MAFYKLEKLINLCEGYRKVFRVEQHDILLIHQSGENYLLENRCPHRGSSLSKATIRTTGASNTLVCPGHGIEFNLMTGQCIKGQCSGLNLYSAAYDQGYLGVSL